MKLIAYAVVVFLITLLAGCAALTSVPQIVVPSEVNVKPSEPTVAVSDSEAKSISLPNLDMNFHEEQDFGGIALSSEVEQTADWINTVWVSPVNDLGFSIGVNPIYKRYTFYRGGEDQTDPLRTYIKQVEKSFDFMGRQIPLGSYVIARDQWGKIPTTLLVDPKNAVVGTFAGFYCLGFDCVEIQYVEVNEYWTQWLQRPRVSVNEEIAHAYCNVKSSSVFIDNRDWKVSLRVDQTGKTIMATSLGNLFEVTGGMHQWEVIPNWTRLQDSPPVYKAEWDGQSITFVDPLNAFTQQPAGEYCVNNFCTAVTYDYWNGSMSVMPLNWVSTRDINYGWCD